MYIREPYQSNPRAKLRIHYLSFFPLIIYNSPGTLIEWRYQFRLTLKVGKHPFYSGYSTSSRAIETSKAVDSLAVGRRIPCQKPHSSHHVIDRSKCLSFPDPLKDLDVVVPPEQAAEAYNSLTKWDDQQMHVVFKWV